MNATTYQCLVRKQIHDLFPVAKLCNDFPDEHQTIEVKISANTFFGARHALSTLQQLIWYDDEDDILKIISTANIVDCPKFK